MWDYTDKVRETFLRPKNVGEIADADAVGEVGSLVCGDALKLFLKIDKASGLITDAKFQTFGCASAIASSSALTELIRGKTLEEALQITNKDIADYLGGLPEQKMHCSVMGKEALEAAAAAYRGEPQPAREGDGIVCRCFDVSEEKIRKVALDNKLTTAEEVTNFTKAGGGCGQCVPRIEAILRELWAVAAPQEQRAPKRMTNLRRIAMIQEVLETEVRPRLQADGGDIELVDVDGDKVIVALRGMCSGCLKADVTLSGVQAKLRELVSAGLTVEADGKNL